MSMLGYYNDHYKSRFLSLPVVPVHDYLVGRHWANLTDFAPGGAMVGSATGVGIWDSNSYGQNLGGTSSSHGRNIGFVDGSHIIGQSINSNNCKPVMMCSKVPIALSTQIASHATSQQQLSNLTITTAVTTVVPLQLEGSRLLDQVVRDTNSTTTSRISSSNSTNNKNNTNLQPGFSNFCYTAPHVRCGNDTEYTIIWNLHVHSKNTKNFRSVRCDCV